MTIDIDVQKTGQVLDDFYNATGINISLWDADFKLLPLYCRKPSSEEFCQCVQTTGEGLGRCFKSDELLMKKSRESGRMELHTCHAGLVDVIVPIKRNGVIEGYILLGQMKRTPEFASVEQLLSWPGADIPALRHCYEKLPHYDSKKIDSVARLAVMLAEYILFSELLKPQHNRNIEAAMTYIRGNLDQPLTVQRICQDTGISKSVLYKVFRKYLNCTVSEYINAERVKKAKELILSEPLAIEEIARRSGFSDSSYFCKIFKKLTGKTPLQFKKADG